MIACGQWPTRPGILEPEFGTVPGFEFGGRPLTFHHRRGLIVALDRARMTRIPGVIQIPITAPKSASGKSRARFDLRPNRVQAASREFRHGLPGLKQVL